MRPSHNKVFTAEDWQVIDSLLEFAQCQLTQLLSEVGRASPTNYYRLLEQWRSRCADMREQIRRFITGD